MAKQIDTRNRLEDYLFRLFGDCHGSADKQYAIGWNVGGDASIVVNRRSPEPRLFIPGGGELDALHGLIRAIRSPGSKVSTLCKPYPGFETRGRIEVAIENEGDLVAVAQYLDGLPEGTATIPATLSALVGQERKTPEFSLRSLKDEAALHAQLVTFWSKIGRFKNWILCDTELSMQSGRADLCAKHEHHAKRHLIVELKITHDDRHVVGQIIDYMADMVAEHDLSLGDVEGLTLCPNPTAHLQSMTRWVSGVTIMPIETLSLSDSIGG